MNRWRQRLAELRRGDEPDDPTSPTRALHNVQNVQNVQSWRVDRTFEHFEPIEQCTQRSAPAGHVRNGGTLGTVNAKGTNNANGLAADHFEPADGTTTTPREARLSEPPDYSERRCFMCGQPARFGFGVHLKCGLEGAWTCAAHRPHGEGHA